MAELGEESKRSPETGEENASPGMSAEELSSLLDGISGAAPLLRGILGAQGKASSEDCSRRETLLHALCPYLSPTRRDAAEYLLRIWRIRDVIRHMH